MIDPEGGTMEHDTSAALLKLAQAVEQETRSLGRVIYTMAAAVERMEGHVGRLDAEMAELRDELLRRVGTAGGE